METPQFTDSVADGKILENAGMSRCEFWSLVSRSPTEAAEKPAWTFVKDPGGLKALKKPAQRKQRGSILASMTSKQAQTDKFGVTHFVSFWQIVK